MSHTVGDSVVVPHHEQLFRSVASGVSVVQIVCHPPIVVGVFTQNILYSRPPAHWTLSTHQL